MDDPDHGFDAAFPGASDFDDRSRRHRLPLGHRPAGHRAARTYDRMAPLYDVLFGWVLDRGRKAMAEAASALGPKSVLEVGVGTGLTLADYPPDAAVVGIDVSRDMLARARARAAALPGRDIRLHLMDAEDTAFADDSYDCVTVPYVLSVTPDPDRLVREIRRVCKPGGAILVVNHFSGSRFWRTMERAVSSLHERIGFRSDFSFEEHILRHDWTVESVRPVNLMGLSRLVVLRNDKPARAFSGTSVAAFPVQGERHRSEP